MPKLMNSVTTIAFTVDHFENQLPSETEVQTALMRRLIDLIQNSEAQEAIGGELVDTRPAEEMQLGSNCTKKALLAAHVVELIENLTGTFSLEGELHD